MFILCSWQQKSFLKPKKNIHRITILTFRNLLQEDLNCYSTWSIQNKLSVNAVKMKIRIFAASKGKLKKCENKDG